MASECQNLLLSSLTNYYLKHPNYRKKLYEIISPNTKTKNISLRVLDWFVTHYAKSKQIVYWVDDIEDKVYFEYPNDISEDKKPNIRKFNLYYDYRAQLQSYTKMYFDPFRRHERISFIIDKEPLIIVETTVGQLNFFKWIIHNHVLDYINNNIKDIDRHMTLYHKSLKNLSNKKVDKKEDKNMFHTITHIPCFVKFD
jgi:hypothetical protein